MQDKNILNKITNLVNLKKDVIEIGPGSGLLTNEILKEPKSLILIEKTIYYMKN